MTTDPISPCPERIELEASAAGDLGVTQLELLARHIDRCDSCGTAVDNFSDRCESGLVADLRTMNLQSTDLKVQNDRHGSDVPVALINAARNAVSRSSVPVSFDAGRRLANRLKDGPCRLGRFELKSELGVGAFGYVRVAKSRVLKRLRLEVGDSIE